MRYIDELSFESGRFTTLLGPSGCGKTTLLRMISGLETPDRGEIWFDELCVFSDKKRINLPPDKRGLGFVFQDFALWPHMTVFENVAFGLRARGEAAGLREHVMSALESVRLDGFEGRYPHQLSGGQQQRVAFARAIVTRPRCILFTQKRGLFQQLFPFTGDFSERFFSFGGLVLVMSLHVFPFMLTIVRNALLGIGASMEESAAIFGGKPFYRLRRVTLPFITGNYAVGALLVFVKTASEYGTPATLGRRIGFDVFVTDIHRSATISPIDFGKAASLSSLLIAICLFAWFLQNYVTMRRSYKLISGKGVRGVENRLGGGKLILAWAVIGVALLVSIGVPYFSVIATSLIKLRGYGLAAGNFTLGHFIDLFTKNPKGQQAFLNSIFLAVTSATIAAVLGTACATVVQLGKAKYRKAVEIVGLMPEMLPGIVFIIGVMLFWNTIYKIVPLYNTIWIMVLAYVTLFLPYSIQYVSASYSQIGDNLIQAGRVFGGGPAYVFRRVTLPLLARGIFAGWMMTFIISFRELVTASLIAPPNTLVVSTFIVREFEQGSVSVGMAMAMVCVLFTTGALILINRFLIGRTGASA